MRKLLNVLYISNPDSYLSHDGENIVVSVEGSEVFRIPIHNVESIVCFGFMGASPALMGLCAKRGVGLCFVSPYGRFLGRVSGAVYGNVLLRKAQYRISDDQIGCLEIAKNCLIGKLANSRVVIERCIRDHGENLDCTQLKDVADYLRKNFPRLQNASSIDELRGIEGDCAKAYFSVFDHLILQQKDTFFMKGRNKRPPLDNLNTLLSFLYTILANDVQSALETVGLDPYVGFLHRDRPGRASLALDIMEEFRAFMVDRLVLSLINRRQVSEKGFIARENGAVQMDESTRKEVLTAWQKRKQEMITHPFIGEKVEIGLLPYVQALLMARFLRGDIDSYPPFLWR